MFREALEFFAIVTCILTGVGLAVVMVLKFAQIIGVMQ